MKILISRYGGLGDAILTLTVALCIRDRFPDAELHVLGNGTMLEVARFSGLFEGFISIDESGFAELFTPSPPSGFLSSFFSRFDAVYFFSSGKMEALRRKIVAAGARLCSVLDPRPPQGFNSHISDHLLKILGDRAEGYNVHSLVYRHIPSDDCRSSRNGLVIHPGSGSHEKNWPLESFVRLARSVDFPVAFLLGPVEIERGFARLLPEDFPIFTTVTLSELSYRLKGAKIYCGNDSGVSHFAGFCDVPSVVLFGPSDPVVWRPLGGTAPVKIVSSPDDDIGHIPVDEVADAVCSLLHEHGNNES